VRSCVILHPHVVVEHVLSQQVQQLCIRVVEHVLSQRLQQLCIRVVEHVLSQHLQQLCIRVVILDGFQCCVCVGEGGGGGTVTLHMIQLVRFRLCRVSHITDLYRARE